jgi:outer membrane protein OmpA-like peptidoglycan-associated protein
MGCEFMKNRLILTCLFVLLCGTLVAQDAQTQPLEPMEHTPVYRVRVVARNISAINYRQHSGSTELNFRGTDLMPQAKGKAEVESRTGRIQIKVDLEGMKTSRNFGSEYLTYVLWAITPEGRPSNLGEIVPRDGKSSIKVSSELQAFGLIVTAEPYFAVTRPSNLVVLENVPKRNTKGWEVPIDTKFEAIERGQYTVDINAAQLPATVASEKVPSDLLQARNAIAIARAEGAERYASDTFDKAVDFLNRAEDYLKRKQGDKAIQTVARGAVQSAEDARLLTIRKREEEAQEAQRREQLRQTQEAQAQAEQARTQAELEARQREQAVAERQRAEQAKTEAEAARQAALAAQQSALLQQQQAQAQTAQAQAAAQQAEQARAQAEQEKQQTRARLTQQLNEVLATRQTARGIIVDMPDVLFDTAKYSLKPGARERLAKVAGILMAYPDLHVEVEGHTDSTGTPEFNQRLSQERADAVREFLLEQGAKTGDIDARGFGEDQPVATNDTAAGRQLNRRVDLVVTGQALGTGTQGSGGSTYNSPGTAPVSTEPDTRTVPSMPAPADQPPPQY